MLSAFGCALPSKREVVKTPFYFHNKHDYRQIYEYYDSSDECEASKTLQDENRVLKAKSARLGEVNSKLKSAADATGQRLSSLSQEVALLKNKLQEAEAKARKALANAETKQERALLLADLENAKQKAEEARKAKERAEREKRGILSEKEQALAKLQKAIEDKEKLKKANEKALVECSNLGKVTREKRGLVVRVADILFEFGKYEIDSATKKRLAKFAKVLSTAMSGKKILVEGHTDNKGGAKLNKALSKNRAKAVMQFLAKNGVSQSRMTYEGHGMDRPIATNKTAEGRRKNRRVNIVILDK